MKKVTAIMTSSPMLAVEILTGCLRCDCKLFLKCLVTTVGASKKFFYIVHNGLQFFFHSVKYCDWSFGIRQKSK